MTGRTKQVHFTPGKLVERIREGFIAPATFISLRLACVYKQLTRAAWPPELVPGAGRHGGNALSTKQRPSQGIDNQLRLGDNLN